MEPVESFPKAGSEEWWEAVGDFIRVKRKARGWSQQDLAFYSKVGRDTVNRIERGERVKINTLTDVLVRLLQEDDEHNAARLVLEEKFLKPAGIKLPLLVKMAPGDHYDWRTVTSNEDQNAEPSDVDVSGYSKDALPVIAEGDASPTGVLWDEDGKPTVHVDEWMSRPDDKAVRDPSCYAIVIRGDSMEPMIRRGMRAIVSPNIPVGEGDLAYVHLTSGERLVKMVHKHPNGWLLESFNREYAPRFVENAEVTALHRIAYVRTLK